jgi:hypothetical protein
VPVSAIAVWGMDWGVPVPTVIEEAVNSQNPSVELTGTKVMSPLYSVGSMKPKL